MTIWVIARTHTLPPTRLQFELTGLAPGSAASTEIVWDGVTKKIATDSEILVEVKRVMDSIGGKSLGKTLK